MSLVSTALAVMSLALSVAAMHLSWCAVKDVERLRRELGKRSARAADHPLYQTTRAVPRNGRR